LATSEHSTDVFKEPATVSPRSILDAVN